MEKVHISKNFYERGRGYSLDLNEDQFESPTQKALPSKRRSTALDTYMVVDRIKVTKF